MSYRLAWMLGLMLVKEAWDAIPDILPITEGQQT